MSNGFGYYVSPARRQREVSTETAGIARLDALLALPVDFDAAASADCYETVFVALLSRENATAFGLTDAEIRDLADMTSADPEWARDIPETGRGWYARGEAVMRRLEETYGDRIATRRELRKYRAAAVRRLYTAKTALSNA